MVDMFSFLFRSKKDRYGFVTAMDYRLFTANEKIDYHNYKGKQAEQLHYDTPLSTIIKKKYVNLLTHDENNDRDFFIPSSEYLSKELLLSKNMDFPSVSKTIHNGEIIEIRSNNDQIEWTSISLKGGNDIATVMGRDNVIQWEDIDYRDIVLGMIMELYTQIEHQK